MAVAPNVTSSKRTVTGTMEWSKIYGGGSNDGAANIKELANGGYIVVGTTSSFGMGGSDIYLLKLDENGDTLWTRTYGGAQDDWGQTVWETSDSGFIILGNSRSFYPFPGYPYSDAYLIRTNSLGDTLWTKIYSYWDGNDDIISWLQPTSDGGYVMAGSSFDHIWVVKTNATGDTLWTSAYDIGTNEFATGIREVSSGYLLTGGVKFGPSANPYNFFLLKLGITTGISDNGTPPGPFILNQNRPNPFSTNTTIDFVLKQTEAVTLKVYDVGGKEVAVLLSGKLNAGKHRISWDAAGLESGIYYYKLDTGPYSIIKKALLLK